MKKITVKVAEHEHVMKDWDWSKNEEHPGMGSDPSGTECYTQVEALCDNLTAHHIPPQNPPPARSPSGTTHPVAF